MTSICYSVTKFNDVGNLFGRFVKQEEKQRAMVAEMVAKLA